MKGRLIAFVGVFCIAILIVSVAYADKPDNPGKPGDKPDKPRVPGQTKAECITFTGNLAGSQQVEGCCLNRGPWPAYTMTLSGSLPAGTYDGQLFVSRAGVGRYPPYMVQFWDDDHDIAIEIIGGVVEDDKTNKVLTVTFTDATCTILGTGQIIAVVNFTLERTLDLTDCPPGE